MMGHSEASIPREPEGRRWKPQGLFPEASVAAMASESVCFSSSTSQPGSVSAWAALSLVSLQESSLRPC